MDLGCASGGSALYELEESVELYSLLEQGCCNRSSLRRERERAEKGAKA